MPIYKQFILTGRILFFYSLFVGIGLVFTLTFAYFWFRPGSIPSNWTGWKHLFDYVIYIALTFVVWYQIVQELFSWYIAFFMKKTAPMPLTDNYSVAFLTAFVPGNEPLTVLEQALKAMVEVKYPHDNWVLDEGDSEEVKTLCKQYGVFHFTRSGKSEYNQSSGKYKSRTKGGNYNAWFDTHGVRYHFVAQIDVDFIPHKNFLIDTLGYFEDPEVGFVGTPQIYGNHNTSFVARGAAEQAFSFYGHTQRGLRGQDMSLFIGANHIVRSIAHHDIDGYSGHIVEDHLTGMKLYSHKWKSVYHPYNLAVGEGPSTWEAYFNQQMRWAYGLMHIFFNESFRLFKDMKANHVFNYFILQQYYFYGLAQCVGVVLLTLFFVGGIQASLMPLWVILAIYVPMLFIQLCITLWLQQFTIDPEHESGLHLKGRLLSFAAWPIYLLAFVSVITGKRLTYKVTPKGDTEAIQAPSLRLFIPHLILGSVTALDMLLSRILHHIAVQLLFFAALNTVMMYSFVVMALYQHLREWAPRSLAALFFNVKKRVLFIGK